MHSYHRYENPPPMAETRVTWGNPGYGPSLHIYIWCVRKYFYNSGCNAFHRTHNRNSKIYDQRREVCTAIMKKFADIEEIANQNEACLVIGPELLFRCIDMLYPCVSGNWNPECGIRTSPSTTEDLWD